MRPTVILPVAAWFLSVSALGFAAEPFSHAPWTEILEHVVDDQGRVDYEGLAVDRAAFDTYLHRVQSTTPETAPGRFPDRDHELAFYINAYNALVFEGVLRRGPEQDSVWSGLISGFTFFNRQKFKIGNRKMNLSDLENEIIRDRYQDPRIHAALNCASVGCPRLPRQAFTGEGLDEQLDEAMREFCNDERHVATVPSEDSVRISKIFDWFQEDFVGEQKRLGLEPSVIGYINRYRSVERQIPIEWEVEILPYDKAVNKQP